MLFLKFLMEVVSRRGRKSRLGDLPEVVIFIFQAYVLLDLTALNVILLLSKYKLIKIFLNDVNSLIHNCKLTI